MGQIQSATYKRANGDSATVRHSMSYGSARKGNRLIVVQSSFEPVTSYSGGWDLLTAESGDGHFLAVYTKIANGGESTFNVDLANSSRVCHMWMVERDDIPELIDWNSGIENGGLSFSLGKAGYVVGGFHWGGPDVIYANNWPLSMSVTHRATNVNSAGDYNFSSDFAGRALNAGNYSINAGSMSGAFQYAWAFAVFGRDSDPPNMSRFLDIEETTADTVTVRWSAATDNSGTIAKYSAYVNGKKVADIGASQRTYKFTGLAAGVELELGITASDADGNESDPATETVTLDATPPTTPGRLRLIGMSTTSLTVSWEASTDDISGLAGYGVYLNGLQVKQQTTRTYQFTGLTTNQQYVIEVDAYDNSGNRSSRAVLRATPKVDTTAPEPPKIKVTALAAGRISIAWDEPFDDSAVATYSVYRGTTKVADQAEQAYTFTGLTPGALYQIGVEAVDLSGNRSVRAVRSIKAQADTTPPTVPDNFRAVATTQTSVTVTWDASTDDNAGVGSYRIYLGGNALADIESQVYTITGLSPGIGYRLAVDAADQVGIRSAKTTLAVETKPDTSGAAPPYEYTFVDWSTHEPIDSLPLQGVSFELGMAGSSKVDATIPLYDERYTVGRVASATLPERTMLVVYRGDRFVAGGRVVDPADYDSTSGEQKISVEDVTQIYGSRFVKFTGPRLETYAHTEVQWLLEHNASPADKRWLSSYAGAAGGGPVDREYRADEFPRILEEANKVAQGQGGFDWWSKPVWDGLNDRPTFQFRRVSRDNPPDTGLVLEYPGNVRFYRIGTQRGLETATFGKLSISDGGVLLSSVVKQDLLDDGWPLIEEAYQFEGLTSKEALDAETARASTAAAGPKLVYELTLMPGHAVKWWDLEIGGLATVVISDHRHPERPDGAPGLDRAMKIVSVRVTPDSEQGEQVTITTGEFTIAID